MVRYCADKQPGWAGWSDDGQTLAETLAETRVGHWPRRWSDSGRDIGRDAGRIVAETLAEKLVGCWPRRWPRDIGRVLHEGIPMLIKFWDDKLSCLCICLHHEHVTLVL
ncbi:hypothetical protein Salat_1230900 [Sesamum alatum]|uniref:Uncharacterized protein n=1 Tax=Sesamum alatum TaxID=300844 RepID=A0AAE2CP31_9LAMI|nr:hypothetical protein Salat_1230900 [Sesamum alatum]